MYTCSYIYQITKRLKTRIRCSMNKPDDYSPVRMAMQTI